MIRVAALVGALVLSSGGHEGRVINQTADYLDKAVVCSECGAEQTDGFYGIWEPWQAVEETKCKEFPYGTDLRQTRTRRAAALCDHCGAVVETVQTEEQNVCHGYHA